MVGKAPSPKISREMIRKYPVTHEFKSTGQGEKHPTTQRKRWARSAGGFGGLG